MFIKKISIPNKDTGKRYLYYRLCESYRLDGSPRHRTILNLGKLEGVTDKHNFKLLADSIERIVYKKNSLFEEEENKAIKELAEHYAQIIITKNLLDLPDKKIRKPISHIAEETDHQCIDINSIRHEQVREVGAEWMCKQTLDRLELAEFLRHLGWDDAWIHKAMIYLIARSVFPASDHKTENWLRQNSALSELYQLPSHRVSRHHLYKVSRMLYENKKEIETFLSKRTGELFSCDEKIMLYDLTNTYFEGEKRKSKKAQFGRSKEKRNDARLMGLAMITDTSGFIKYSKIYEGNIKDNNTLESTLRDIQTYPNQKSGIPRIVVMDAGIATEDNLKLIRTKPYAYDYVCVSLSKMADCQPDSAQKGVELKDKKGNKIWVQWVKSEKHKDNILYVKSEKKALKEAGMDTLFCKRYEEGLASVKKAIDKKGGIKKADKVHQRLGRLKEKYSSVNRFYKINIKVRDNIVIGMNWKKIQDRSNKHGVYFIRTSLDTKNEKIIWDIYNTIREIEATFRVLKTDLNMRPIFHQEDIYSEAHIYSSLLASTIVNTIRHPLKSKGINLDWRNILRIMNSQKIITTSLKSKNGNSIYIKKCSEPENPVKEIYQALNYKDKPFWQKKSVLPKNEK